MLALVFESAPAPPHWLCSGKQSPPLPGQGQSLATPRAGAAGKGKVQEDSLGWGWGVPTGTPSFLPHSFHEEVYRSSVKVKPLASGIKARLWHLAMGVTSPSCRVLLGKMRTGSDTAGGGTGARGSSMGDHRHRGKPGRRWETVLSSRRPSEQGSLAYLAEHCLRSSGGGWDEACIQIQTKGRSPKTTLQLI